VEYRFRVELDAGGRFRVPVPQYRGKAARLTVEVADEQAKAVPVTFSSSVLRTDARQGRTGGTGLLVGASSLSSALQPGTYTVRVSAPDAKTFEGRVVIEAGKTVELPVALDPR
jgi:PEGA domain